MSHAHAVPQPDLALEILYPRLFQSLCCRAPIPNDLFLQGCSLRWSIAPTQVLYLSLKL